MTLPILISLLRFAAEAERVGYPILVKAAFGGGGRGMKLAATSRVSEERTRFVMHLHRERWHE